MRAKVAARSANDQRSPGGVVASRPCAAAAGIAARRKEITVVVVVVASGSAPDARQRRELQAVWAGAAPPPAPVLTRSAVIRSILTALDWFVASRLRPFAPTETAAALDDAGVPAGAAPGGARDETRLASA